MAKPWGEGSCVTDVYAELKRAIPAVLETAWTSMGKPFSPYDHSNNLYSFHPYFTLQYFQVLKEQRCLFTAFMLHLEQLHLKAMTTRLQDVFPKPHLGTDAKKYLHFQQEDTWPFTDYAFDQRTIFLWDNANKLVNIWVYFKMNPSRNLACGCQTISFSLLKKMGALCFPLSLIWVYNTIWIVFAGTEPL